MTFREWIYENAMDITAGCFGAILGTIVLTIAYIIA